MNEFNILTIKKIFSFSKSIFNEWAQCIPEGMAQLLGVYEVLFDHLIQLKDRDKPNIICGGCKWAMFG